MQASNKSFCPPTFSENIVTVRALYLMDFGHTFMNQSYATANIHSRKQEKNLSLQVGNARKCLNLFFN